MEGVVISVIDCENECDDCLNYINCCRNCEKLPNCEDPCEKARVNKVDLIEFEME